MATGDGCCSETWHWISNILAWASIIFFLVVLVLRLTELYTVSIILFSVFLLIYYITQFCSSSCSYLFHRTETASVYNYMENMFYRPMYKVMHIQCFHYETRTYSDRDSNGNTTIRTESVRVNTHSATERYYYISWRDISGKFDLDVSGAMTQHERPFVKFHLGLIMQLAEDGTQGDFEHQKYSFIARNNWDVHYDFSERLELDGYNEHTLVRVSDYNPPCFSSFWFIFFTLLTMVEFYKFYMDKFCIVQRFDIVKVVSSRQDLNAPQYVQQYITFAPCIIYMNEVHNYNGPMVLPQGALVPPPPTPPEGSPGKMNMNIQMNPQMQPGVPHMSVNMNVNMNKKETNAPLL